MNGADCIPEYLISHGKPRLIPSDFDNQKKFYRLKKKGNPIEIPPGWENAISVKYSGIIKKNDILLIDANNDWNDYGFAYVKEFRQLKIIDYNTDKQDLLSGQNIIICDFFHDLKPLDYSHCEIRINHRIIKDSVTIHNEIYTHEAWLNKQALLRKRKGKFYKELRQKFRNECIKRLGKSSKYNTRIHDMLYMIFGRVFIWMFH